MKKTLVAILFFLLSVSIPSTGFGQDYVQSGRPIVAQEPSAFPMFGQDHAYSVNFRGNGEAVISGRIIFANTQTQSQDQLVFRVPKVIPQDIIAYQVIKEPQCVRYAYLNQDTISPNQPLGSNRCLEYDQPSYYDYWYGKTSYKRAKTIFEGDTLTVLLPQSISPERSGSILVYFRAVGYANKTFSGSYEYSFETLQANEFVRSLMVGISTDDPYKLRGVQSNVNYRFSTTQILDSAEQSIDSSAKINEAFNSYYQQIGSGQIVKQSTDLQPLESFVVSGSYADSFVKLYAKEIVVVPSLIIGIVIGIAILTFWLQKKYSQKKDGQRFSSHFVRHLAVVGFVSFVSGFSLSLYTAGVGFVLLFLRNVYLQGFEIFLSLVLLVISLFIYTFGMFGPSIIVWKSKNDVRWGGLTFLLTFSWIVVFCSCLLIILFMITRSSFSPPIISL